MDRNTLLAFLVTMFGWAIVHFLAKRRDVMNKKKEIRINYLINAWRLLESASNRPNSDLNKNIEIAIADIQLLGTKRQIELAQKIAIDISSSGTGESLELLKELRKELNIDKVPDTFKFIRFN